MTYPVLSYAIPRIVTVTDVPTCRKGHPLTPENRRTDGGSCRTCKRIAARARYARDDKQKNAVKAWREANPERVQEHQRRSHSNPNAKIKKKEWEARNPDKVRMYNRRAYERDGENIRKRVRAYLAKQRLEDPDLAYRKTRAWIEANPERAKMTARNAYAKRRDAPSLPFTDAQLAERMAYFGNRCWMCGGPFEHIDHVKPLARGGWHALMNLRPACRSCNCSKKAAWPLERLV